ncbi:phosphoserine phosphatase SerB [Frondihabitans cladoniiphilus]|uniref:phosphoserine phosphatase n=1 Tax=Frondihabitans cladoniiphilus TaxID=715785 RepID=A0ABP8W7V3_9MICO
MPRFLLVLDVDSTLIENEVIEMIADAAGSHDAVKAITDRAMAGEIDFAESLRERVATLEGLDVGALDSVRRDVVVTRGVPELVEGVHAAGGLVGVVSGGFHEILDPLAERLGLDFWHANRLEAVAGRLTGFVDGPIVDAAAKAEALREWARDARVDLAHTVAIGDGANDLAMMEVAALSVAFDAKPRVRAAADVAIATRDLAQVLPLLGLRG